MDGLAFSAIPPKGLKLKQWNTIYTFLLERWHIQLVFYSNTTRIRKYTCEQLTQIHRWLGGAPEENRQRVNVEWAIFTELYNWHTDPCHLIGGTYFTWHSLLLPSAPAFKKTYSPLGNIISHSTVRIILVSNVFQQYSAAAPLLKQWSTCAKGCDPICLLPLRGAIWFLVVSNLCDF